MFKAVKVFASFTMSSILPILICAVYTATTLQATYEPTNQPKNPTNPNPTMSNPTTSIPTPYPTPNPASNQAPKPSAKPSPKPTPKPTSKPTPEPTFKSTSYSTTPQTSLTTTTESSSTSISAAKVNEFEQDLKDLQLLFQYIIIGFVLLCLLMGVIGSIDAKLCRINDHFEPTPIISLTLQSVDMISDCFFIAQINIENKIDPKPEYRIIFIASICFVVIPAFTSLFQLFSYARKHWIRNDRSKRWLSNYSALLLLCSICTGSSFVAVALFNTYIFKLNIFDMGLTRKQLTKFSTRRIYSIVLLEVLFSHILHS